MDDLTERETHETTSEHAEVTELHRAFDSGIIGELDYDRALARIYSNRDHTIKTAA